METHTPLEEFFKNALQDIYYAEQQLVKALSRMEEESTTDELKQAFRIHRMETEVHVERLEEAFEAIGEPARTQKCEAIEGLDLDTVADLLAETLEEEKNTNDTLTDIAENYLYEAAKAE